MGPARIEGAHKGFLWHQAELLTYLRKPDGKNNRCKMYCTKETNIAFITILILKIKELTWEPECLRAEGIE